MKSMREIFESHCVRDAQGRHTNGTDKSSNHDYGPAYESLFPDRLAVKLLMEVGNADGSSLLAWRDIFPDAHCVGLDIHPLSRSAPDRFEFHLGDQRSKEDCERAAAGRQFDFICEDATHVLKASMLTLLYLWPFVKPGGLYVIEEFSNVEALRENIMALWPTVDIVNTIGPFGGLEPLVVFRKPL